MENITQTNVLETAIDSETESTAAQSAAQTEVAESVVTETVAAQLAENAPAAELPVESVAAVDAPIDVAAKPEAAESSAEQSDIPVKAESVKKPETNKNRMAAAMKALSRVREFRKGQVITAAVSLPTDEGLQLLLPNTKKEILLSKENISGEYNKDNYADVKEIRVMIINTSPVVLSEKAMLKIIEQEKEIEEIKNGKIFEAVMTEANKGGLTGKIGNYMVFVPSSQIRIGFVKEPEKYVGKTFRLKLIKVEEGKRRQIVASQRVILEEEKAKADAERAVKENEFFDSIGIGDIVSGKVVRFSSFGAFVSVGDFDCLAHISDLSWTGCRDCSEVLKLNEEYEFMILKIDRENRKVSLGYKQLQPKIWDTVLQKYAIGDVIKGKVVRIVSFGAFVEIEKNLDGLVHVSQISNEWLDNPLKALKVGDEVDAKIIDINIEKEKISLSIKALLQQPQQSDEDEKPGKGGKKSSKSSKNDYSTEVGLKEWTDGNGAISIAEMLDNK